jgi:hypothetical protein
MAGQKSDMPALWKLSDHGAQYVFRCGFDFRTYGEPGGAVTVDFLQLILVDEKVAATACCARDAQRLMKIASDPTLANAAHAQLLPAAWGALYELTKLDDETFKQAASSGAIHPAMTRKDATRRRYLTVQVVDRTHRIAAPIIRMTESKPKSTRASGTSGLAP